METNINIQEQISDLSKKMDLMLGYVNEQRQKFEVVEDLVADMSIIGKDMYDSSVSALEKQCCSIHPDEFRLLFVKLLTNVKTFNSMLGTLESVTDLMKDAAPIANEIIIDFTKKMYEFEQKGYFSLLKEFAIQSDKIITHYKSEDLKDLADRFILTMNVVNNITQPEIMNFVNNAAIAAGNVDQSKIKKYSLWKLLKDLRSPQLRKTMGFAMQVIKDTVKINKQINN
jgi:uncharacterized protein YjgD (DUF1641 family)